MKKRRELKPIFKYMIENNIRDRFYYEYDKKKRELMIYTRKPESWIWDGSSGVKTLQKYLKDEFGHGVSVGFMKLKGIFISSDDTIDSHTQVN